MSKFTIFNESTKTEVIEFSNTNARFFGELGSPNLQSWTNNVTGTATVDVVNETINGIPQDVIRINDVTTSGLAGSEIALTTQDWVDINSFGASFSGLSRLDTTNGGSGFFAGIQDNDVDRRYGLTFTNSGGFLRIGEVEGTSQFVIFDGTNGNPEILFDEWVNWSCDIPSGLGAATFTVNGSIVSGFTPNFNINTGGGGSRVLVTSGSTGGTNRVSYHSNFGVTIYRESNIKTINPTDLTAPITRVIIPEGIRTYTLIVSDAERDNGDILEVIANNVGGMVIFRTENFTTPKTLFNGLHLIAGNITEKTVVRAVNTVQDEQIYVIDQDQLIDHIPRVEQSIEDNTKLTAMITGLDRALGAYSFSEISNDLTSNIDYIRDISGKGNHVTFVDTNRPNIVNGLKGISVTDIDTTSTKMDITEETNLGENFTIMFWINSNTVGNNYNLFSKREAIGAGIKLFINTFDGLTFTVYDAFGSVADTIATTGITLNDGRDHHVCVSCFADTLFYIYSVYVDGFLVARISTTNAPLVNNNETINIGYDKVVSVGFDDYDDLIDDFYVFNELLELDKIRDYAKLDIKSFQITAENNGNATDATQLSFGNGEDDPNAGRAMNVECHLINWSLRNSDNNQTLPPSGSWQIDLHNSNTIAGSGFTTISTLTHTGSSFTQIETPTIPPKLNPTDAIVIESNAASNGQSQQAVLTFEYAQHLNTQPVIP